MSYSSQTEIVIEVGRTEREYWKNLWRYRELFYFLAWRDILVRYKQTAIGVSWALIRPFLTMVVFTIVYGFRWAILGNAQLYLPGFVLSVILVGYLCIGGVWYFRKMERNFC
nr:hypothetical protein [Roseofilum capinflatum]